MILRLLRQLARRIASPPILSDPIELSEPPDDETLAEEELEVYDTGTSLAPLPPPPDERRRGAVRPTTPEEAVDRARSMIGYRPDRPDGERGTMPIRYRLRGGYNGGTDPWEPHPAAWSGADMQGLAWSDSGAWTVDCSGLACWAIGLDRYRPGEPVEWLSTDGMLRDARQHRTHLELTDEPQPGDLLVYGSRWENGQRVQVGHVGIIVDASGWDGAYRSLRVVHAAASLDRQHGAAIHETGGLLWDRRGGVVLRRVG